MVVRVTGLGDYEFNPINVAILGVVVVVVAGLGLTAARNESKGNQIRDTKVKVARVEACRDVKDDALRVFCVVEGAR